MKTYNSVKFYQVGGGIGKMQEHYGHTVSDEKIMVVMQEFIDYGEKKAAFEKEILLNRTKNYKNIFENARARQIIEHIKEHYGDELEFLWLDSPNSAIFRHKENKKWYALVVALNARKLGLKAVEIINIMNVKAKPKIIDDLVDNASFFRAYHMNKKHWLTIKLDESVNLKTFKKLVEESYQMTGKR